MVHVALCAGFVSAETVRDEATRQCSLTATGSCRLYRNQIKFPLSSRFKAVYGNIFPFN